MKKVTIPLLLLAGGKDEKFIDINIAMTEKCNFTKLQIIHQVGHNIHLENTLVFVQNIQDFFAGSLPFRIQTSLPSM